MGQAAKYSCCLYPTGKETLDEAEVLMLESYCEKAQIKDGMDILDLGCGIYPFLLIRAGVLRPYTGWGSLTLHLAMKYPNARIVGLSNSTTQKAHIDNTAKSRGYSNVEVCSFSLLTGSTLTKG